MPNCEVDRACRGALVACSDSPARTESTLSALRLVRNSRSTKAPGAPSSLWRFGLQLANVALPVRFLIWRAGWADIYGQGAPPLVDGGAPCCVWVVGAIYRCETISSILPSRSMELTALGASRWLPLWTGSPQTVPSPSMTDRHMKGQRWSRILLPSTRTRSTV